MLAQSACRRRSRSRISVDLAIARVLTEDPAVARRRRAAGLCADPAPRSGDDFPRDLLEHDGHVTPPPNLIARVSSALRADVGGQTRAIRLDCARPPAGRTARRRRRSGIRACSDERRARTTASSAVLDRPGAQAGEVRALADAPPSRRHAESRRRHPRSTPAPALNPCRCPRRHRPNARADLPRRPRRRRPRCPARAARHAGAEAGARTRGEGSSRARLTPAPTPTASSAAGGEAQAGRTVGRGDRARGTRIAERVGDARRPPPRTVRRRHGDRLGRRGRRRRWRSGSWLLSKTTSWLRSVRLMLERSGTPLAREEVERLLVLLDHAGEAVDAPAELHQRRHLLAAGSVRP